MSSFLDRFTTDEELNWKELVTFTQYAKSIPELIHLQYAVSSGMIHIRERDNKAIEPEICDVLIGVTSSFVNRPATADIIADMVYEIGSKLQRFAGEGRIIL